MRRDLFVAARGLLLGLATGTLIMWAARPGPARSLEPVGAGEVRHWLVKAHEPVPYEDVPPWPRRSRTEMYLYTLDASETFWAAPYMVATKRGAMGPRGAKGR